MKFSKYICKNHVFFIYLHARCGATGFSLKLNLKKKECLSLQDMFYCRSNIFFMLWNTKIFGPIWTVSVEWPRSIREVPSLRLSGLRLWVLRKAESSISKLLERRLCMWACAQCQTEPCSYSSSTNRSGWHITNHHKLLFLYLWRKVYFVIFIEKVYFFPL